MTRVLSPFVIGALLGGAAIYLANRLGAEPAADELGSRGETSLLAPAANDGNNGASRLPGNESGAGPIAVSELDAVARRAAVDPEALLAELGALSPPALQRRAALAVLDALGNDDATLFRVAAMLPEANRLAFRIDAIAARAVRDPASALRSALALDSTAARRAAVPLIAEAAAELDASDALRQAALIGNRELRSLYVARVAVRWAEHDAPAALAYLSEVVPTELPPRAAAEAFEAIAATDHDLLLDNLDGVSAAVRPLAQRAALLALAERDAQAALDAIAALAPGRNRTETEAAFAELYALDSPREAVAWAKSLPDSQSALEAALRGAAAADFDLAVDLAMEALETEPIWPVLALVESGAGEFGQVADRLLASTLENRDSNAEALMVRWPQIDAKAALEWSLVNVDRLEKNWLSRLALDGGREQPELAMALLDSIPRDLREAWIAGVAGGVAAFDSARALAFLEQHRGEPGYDAGLAGVVNSLTGWDAAAAAKLVETTGARAAGRVTWAWSQQDPRAAAAWVDRLEDPDMRTDAVINLVGSWARSEPDAAIAWLLDFPTDDRSREVGLELAISSAAVATGLLDERALNAIGNDRVRERAAVGAIVAIGRSDAETARRLLDRHVKDPGAHRQTLQRLATQRGGGDAVTVSSSFIDVPR